mgnify:CR=1 FL=1
MFLTLTKGFGMHHDLVLAVYRRYTGIALNDTMTGLHLGAFVVGDVALHRFSAGSFAFGLGIQKTFDLAGDGP